MNHKFKILYFVAVEIVTSLFFLCIGKTSYILSFSIAFILYILAGLVLLAIFPSKKLSERYEIEVFLCAFLALCYVYQLSFLYSIILVAIFGYVFAIISGVFSGFFRASTKAGK